MIELSFSRVQAYQRCPWLYHLVFDEGWRSGPKSGMALGLSLHRTLAAYLAKENTERTQERLFEMFDQHWVNEGFASPQQTLDVYDNGRKMLERFFETERDRHAEVIATEHEFAVNLEADIRFRGSMDRLDRHPDGTYEVVEYKTQAEHWSEARVAADLQMTFYALGIQKSLGNVPLKLTYHFLSNGQRMETVRSPEQLAAAETLLSAIAKRLHKREYEPNHAHCPRCEFGPRCSNFKKEERKSMGTMPS